MRLADCLSFLASSCEQDGAASTWSVLRPFLAAFGLGKSPPVSSRVSSSSAKQNKAARKQSPENSGAASSQQQPQRLASSTVSAEDAGGEARGGASSSSSAESLPSVEQVLEIAGLEGTTSASTAGGTSPSVVFVWLSASEAGSALLARLRRLAREGLPKDGAASGSGDDAPPFCFSGEDNPSLGTATSARTRDGCAFAFEGLAAEAAFRSGNEGTRGGEATESSPLNEQAVLVAFFRGGQVRGRLVCLKEVSSVRVSSLPSSCAFSLCRRF